MYRRGQLEMIAGSGTLGRRVSPSLANRMRVATPFTLDSG